MANRPSVSMRAEVARRLAWAAEVTGQSKCAFVERAIDERMRMYNIPEPPDGWEPPRGKGRPSAAERRANLAQDQAANFTW